MATATYREKAEIKGVVFQVNTERRKFRMRTAEGVVVTAPYTDETRHRVMNAIADPENVRVKVSGLAEFYPGSVLKRMVKVDNILLAIPEREIPADKPTIGEIFDAMTSELPPETWAGLPTDLSVRHNAFYGFDTEGS